MPVWLKLRYKMPNIKIYPFYLLTLTLLISSMHLLNSEISMNTGIFKSPFKKAICTFIWYMSQTYLFGITNTISINDRREIGTRAAGRTYSFSDLGSKSMYVLLGGFLFQNQPGINYSVDYYTVLSDYLSTSLQRLFLHIKIITLLMASFNFSRSVIFVTSV